MKFDSVLKKELPIVNINFSKKSINKIRFYDGLIIANSDSTLSNTDLHAFVNSTANIIKVDKKNRSEFIRDIKNLIVSKQVDIKDINKKLKKIIKAKYWHKLQTAKLDSYNNNSLLYLTKLDNYLLKKKSLTLVSNHKKTIPVKNISKTKFIIYSAYNKKTNDFLNIFKYYSSYDILLQF